MSIVPNRKSDSISCADSLQNKSIRLGCSIKLEYADMYSEQVLGLSARKDMPKDKGMLFAYDHAATRCMWMKDMSFSLDMIWLDKGKRVLKIAKDVSPDTFPQSFCATHAKYVIELNAGIVDELGYKIGDYIKL
ncbi:MAG TPA: DUF192 domain-containing protein [Patescibacteria group bacterium]|nr:DUF192 domain-containing protein [Patescibacteria group bacterium]